jgi:hypothetical protein
MPLKLEIIKGLPLPESRTRAVGVARSEKFIYPFAEMEIGDAIEAPVGFLNRVRTAGLMYGKLHGRKYVARGNYIFRTQ